MPRLRARHLLSLSCRGPAELPVQGVWPAAPLPVCFPALTHRNGFSGSSGGLDGGDPGPGGPTLGMQAPSLASVRPFKKKAYCVCERFLTNTVCVCVCVCVCVSGVGSMYRMPLNASLKPSQDSALVVITWA